MGDDNGAQPTFDFEDVSYGWQRDWMKTAAELATTTTLIDQPAAEGISEVDAHRLTLAKLEAVDKLDGLISRRDALVAQVLVDVPRAWLVKNAPDALDWSCADSLRYVRSKRLNDILTAMQEAQAANSKN